MSVWLIDPLKCPPQEFWYRQADCAPFTFSNTPLLKELAEKVAAHRQANGCSGASITQAYTDIVLFTCARLNNDPAYVMQTDRDPSELGPQFNVGCGSCGAQIK